MSNSQVLEIQQGVWIDERWLQSAGLGPRIQVVVQAGEIRIVPALGETEQPQSAELGWNVFRALGKNARPGKLPNAAAEHDRYLYSRGK